MKDREAYFAIPSVRAIRCKSGPNPASVLRAFSFYPYCFPYRHDATAAAIFENGSLKYTLPDLVKSSDVIRIERSGTPIRYYKNGELLYTSAKPSSTESER